MLISVKTAQPMWIFFPTNDAGQLQEKREKNLYPFKQEVRKTK